ncbi:MAG: hypothetical protein QOH41_1639 [Blastocatellia bacterium]|jgi:hypothetical protein|nr:hypothetical protein [Blastocatellia bacterium]
MAKKGNSFDDIQADGDNLVRVWNDNQSLSLGDVSREAFNAMMTEFRTAREGLESLRTQITGAVNDVNDRAKTIKGITVRGRAAARGQFGGNSTQYEQLGGTRTSDRKPRKKKTPKS